MHIPHRFLVSVAIAAIMSFSFAGLLHAIVPHEHGEGEEHEHASPVWEMIHGALAREEAKVILPPSLSLVWFFTLLLPVISVLALRANPTREPLIIMLASGRLAYRRFG